jgi:hypothetical protein
LNSAAVIGRNRIGSIPAIIDGSGWPLLGRQLRSFRLRPAAWCK